MAAVGGPDVGRGASGSGDERYERALRLAKRLKQMLEQQKKATAVHQARLMGFLSVLREMVQSRRSIGSGSEFGEDGLSLETTAVSINEKTLDALLPQDGGFGPIEQCNAAVQLGQQLVSDVVTRAASRMGGPGSALPFVRPVCVLHSESTGAAGVSEEGDVPSGQSWVLLEITAAAREDEPGTSSAPSQGAVSTQVWVRGSALQLSGDEDDELEASESEGAAPRTRGGLLLEPDWSLVPVLAWRGPAGAAGGAGGPDGRAEPGPSGRGSGGGEWSVEAQAELAGLREALQESRAAEGRARVEAEVAARRAAAELAESRRALEAAEDEAAALRDRAGEAAAQARSAEAGRVRAQEAATAALQGALAGSLGDEGSAGGGGQAGRQEDGGVGAEAGWKEGIASSGGEAEGRAVELEKVRRDFAAYRRRAMELLKRKERIADEAEEAVAGMRREMRAARERVAAAEAEAERLRRLRGAASAVPVRQVPLQLPPPAPAGGGFPGGGGAAGGGAAQAMMRASEAAAAARLGSTAAAAAPAASHDGADGVDAGANDARVAYLRNLVLRYMVQRRRASRESSALDLGGVGAALGAGGGAVLEGAEGGGVVGQMEAAIADILGFGPGERRQLELGGSGGSVGGSEGQEARSGGGLGARGGGAAGDEGESRGQRPLGLLAKRELQLRGEQEGGGGVGGGGAEQGGLLGGLWTAIVGSQEDARPRAIDLSRRRSGAAAHGAGVSVLDSAPG